MASTIRSDGLSSAIAQERLRQGLDAYCSFRATMLSGALPCGGNKDHDVRLAGVLRDALDSFNSMIAADAKGTQTLHERLLQTDAQSAAAMRG